MRRRKHGAKKAWRPKEKIERNRVMRVNAYNITYSVVRNAHIFICTGSSFLTRTKQGSGKICCLSYFCRFYSNWNIDVFCASAVFEVFFKTISLMIFNNTLLYINSIKQKNRSCYFYRKDCHDNPVAVETFG